MREDARVTLKALLVTLLSLLAAFWLVLVGPVCAQAAATAKLLPAQSEIGFVSKQMGVPVDGRFKRFDARLDFDPKAPDQGSVTIAVDLSSVDIGADAEAELAKPGWFDSAHVKNASFASTSIKRVAPGKLDVAGKLTIKGIAHETTVPVALTQRDGVTVASGSFPIKRLDFKIGDGEWGDTSLVADDVQVKFKLAFAGVGPLP
jgi:polyisoprenoid-binding protein YceI